MAQAMATNTSKPNALCRDCIGRQAGRASRCTYGRRMVKTLSTKV